MITQEPVQGATPGGETGALPADFEFPARTLFLCVKGALFARLPYDFWYGIDPERRLVRTPLPDLFTDDCRLISEPEFRLALATG